MKLAVEGIFFDHLRKTGGTAIYEWLSDWLGRDRVSPMFGLRPYAEVTREFADRALISGHCHYVSGDGLDAARFNVTALRDPVDRVLSEYSYCHFDLPSKPGLPGSEFIRLARASSLEEFIELKDETVSHRISNEQARHFVPLGAYLGNADDVGASRLARLALRGFDLVGTQERLDTFVGVLGRCFGMSDERIARFRRTNVTSRRLGRQHVDARIVSRIEQLNEWDIELYETARTLEQEHLRAWSELAKEFPAPVRILPRTAREAVASTAHRVAGGKSAPRGMEIVAMTIMGEISKGAPLLSGENVEIGVLVRSDVDEEALTVALSIEDEAGRIVFATNTRQLGTNLGIRAGGRGTVSFRSRLDIGNGRYFVGAQLQRGSDHSTGVYHLLDRAVSMQVAGSIGGQFRGYARLHMSCSADGISTDAIPMSSSIAIDAPCIANPVAGLEIVGAPATVRRNEIFTIDALVRNLGADSWTAEAIRPVVLSYKWLQPSTGESLVSEGDRTRLPRDVPPREAVRMPVLLRAPATSGRLIAELRVLQEHCSWFDAPAQVEITIV